MTPHGSVVFRPEAIQDVEDARDWYEAQSPGLGIRFENELGTLVDQIRRAPEMYAKVFQTLRRGMLNKFPYVVYYQVIADGIEVVAVLHGRRDRRAWRSRVK